MDFKDETSFRGMIHYNWFINNWFLINYHLQVRLHICMFRLHAENERKTSKETTILFKTTNYRIFFTVGLLTEER